LERPFKKRPARPISNKTSAVGGHVKKDFTGKKKPE